MNNFYLNSVLTVCLFGACFIQSNAQVQRVTVRSDDVPDFLRTTEATPVANTDSDAVTTTENSRSVYKPRTPEEAVDDARFKSVKGTESHEFWANVVQEELAKRQSIKPLEKVAKNIIYFIGDGMSGATVTAARIFKGQKQNLKFGEEGSLHFDTFPYLGSSKTFCSDAQVADSACSATALFCGSKTNIGTIGVTPSVLVGECAKQMKKENQLSSILAWAQKAGKSTGIVTTTRITHATPAGTYASIAHRDWENDVEITKSGLNSDECDDVAEQLILSEPGKNINVILGGGRKHLLPSSLVDLEGQKGARNDSKHLIDEWKRQKQDKKAKYVETVEDLLNVDTNEVDYLMGLFSSDHIEYSDNLTINHDPTLYNMTKIAIRILSKNPNGFFLMVEGGRIDHALHDNVGQRALLETVQLDEAVKLADDMTADDDTLITVTSDHAHVMSIAGYPIRGNPILGIAENSDVDGLPYTTIAFANGPGFRNTTEGVRANVSKEDFMKVDYRHHAGIPLKYETHGGDDVFIFSKGPYAHYLTGVNYQNYIPHVLAFAACIKPEAEGFKIPFAQSPLCKGAHSHDHDHGSHPSGASSQINTSFTSNLVVAIFAVAAASANWIATYSL